MANPKAPLIPPPATVPSISEEVQESSVGVVVILTIAIDEVVEGFSLLSVPFTIQNPEPESQ
jgi:hypothetical protein